MMTKKEFISQLTLCASRYADERLGDNNKLFASNQHLREDMLEWEQKYHSAMAANKKLEERNEGLQVEIHCLLQSRTEELAKREKDWSAAFAAAKEKHEDFKKGSDEILATMGENLQKKQETIEALTTWKAGAESVLDTLEAKLKNAKDVIQAQENTIEWLGASARLKAKKAKKEQND